VSAKKKVIYVYVEEPEYKRLVDQAKANRRTISQEAAARLFPNPQQDSTEVQHDVPGRREDS
jgi:hypothetical protein